MHISQQGPSQLISRVEHDFCVPMERYWESSIAPEMYKMLIPMADRF